MEERLPYSKPEYKFIYPLEYVPPLHYDEEYQEWVMVKDDFDDGYGEREYPHCSKCGRGVYNHDAGKYCPFCGSPMLNPKH